MRQKVENRTTGTEKMKTKKGLLERATDEDLTKRLMTPQEIIQLVYCLQNPEDKRCKGIM